MQTATAPVQMLPVQSSMFCAIGYNEETQELYAKYNTGTIGAYGPTTLQEYETILGHEQGIGKTFNQIIKPRKHFRKVDDLSEVCFGEAPQSIRAIVHEMAPTPQAAVEVLSQPAAPEVTRGSSLKIALRASLNDEPLPDTFLNSQEVEVKQQTTDIATRAHSLAVTTPAAHMAGQELIVAIASMKKQVTEFFKPMKDAAHKAHKAVCDRETEVLSPLADAQKQLSTKLVAFERQVEADRRAEQERLRLEQQKRAEEEAKAEAERLAIEDAIALEDAGDVAGAEAVLANPVPVAPRYVPPPVVASVVQRVSGVVAKEVWKARIVDASLIPREWMIPDESALNKHASTRKHLAVVPGVEFYPETAVHGRTK